jgi:hypothetical protein
MENYPKINESDLKNLANYKFFENLKYLTFVDDDEEGHDIGGEKIS